jgi:hypothetical protein
MINCSGFKVYPRLVEEAIYQHPAVRECAVIGVPDAYRGQTVKAIVALKADASLSEEQLAHFLEDKLSKIEKPTQYEFRADLPKTAVGKIQKKILSMKPRPPLRPPKEIPKGKSYERGRHRRLCPVALPFRQQGRSDPSPAGRSDRRRGQGADRQDRHRSRRRSRTCCSAAPFPKASRASMSRA